MKFFFAWYDIWVGFYYDRVKTFLYFCPLPMLVFRFGPFRRTLLQKLHRNSEGPLGWRGR
jgi:hypothetical protein